ncbi:MAG: HAD family hydrolase [Planctomycetes bacterium]|nr:HAD family hydrolase [Planctomycetota bacterium]MBU4399887.1 HAD family hydrolase [Planctomycetota bacterium]MCG2683044.1 HAD family hydrolase [Planctomycetales bacterium]
MNFTPKHDYLVGIDSDGCAFDTMELKHKECFIPNIINHWGLQGVSKYAREAAEFVNLYSKSRGINRFPALIEALEWINKRPEVKARGVYVEIPQSLRDWMKRETKLGNPALEKEVERTGDADLKHALEWSRAVNESIAQMVRGVPPFPFVRESLEKLSTRADVLVVSATPHEALQREWVEHDLSRYTVAICGQEIGTKKESLSVGAKYPANHTLMIGDAPGDHKAAVANHALFFPINPGAEEASWQRLFEEGIDRFIAGTFAGEYEAALLAEFDRRLPEHPPWKVVDSG